MEGIHGVDVSWLHRSKSDHASTAKTPSNLQRPASPRAAASFHSQRPSNGTASPTPEENHRRARRTESSPPPAGTASAPQPIPDPKQRKSGLFRGSSSSKDDKASAAFANTASPKTPPKKSGWMSSLSSKFSPQVIRATPSVESLDGGKPFANAREAAPTSTPAQSVPEPTLQRRSSDEALDVVDDLVGSPPSKGGTSFFSTALRRLSTNSTGKSGLAPRQILNVDEGRERCPVKELNASDLRRVAFCVDVEIAGTSRYGPSEDDGDKKKKQKDKKMKEQGEGAALKNPQAVAASTERQRVNSASGVARAADMFADDSATEEGTASAAAAIQREEAEAEEKRRHKEEKRRRREEKAAAQAEAEASSSVPIPPTSAAPTDTADASESTTTTSGQAPQAQHRPQDRPTTDPLRMYRRCCQLREAPVLKRISEQLQKMQNTTIEPPGVVHCLDLRRSRMQLTDIVCLGDWLAIVPIKKLLLEDANLTDEGVRIILSGLLAAKPPGLVKRKRGRSSPHRLRDNTIYRTPGVIEKVSLKNNPKITSEGWKHICLFLTMSKSLKAIDVSCIPFPQTFQMSPVSSGEKLFGNRNSADVDRDLTQLLAKSICKRLARDHLEELIMAECNLNTAQVGAIVDAAIQSHLHILGMASNNLDRDGLEHVARFVKSGYCHALDIGGTDLSENYDVVVDALSSNSSIWALSVANCNLDATSVAKLMPVLAALPDFRFLDLSHHRDLFARRRGTLRLLRQYLPRIHMLKRIHLVDVSMTPAQAIGLAEILPECVNLAHINILENPQLTALAGPASETDQEEACAFYASYMTAVRLSKTMIAVDVDVPGKDSSDIVKALARQVIAYCLRNLNRYTELGAIQVSDAASALPDIPDKDKDVAMPELLTQLLQQLEGQGEGESKQDRASADDDKNAALDDDYFVGATGLVKALSYFLNASEMRRLSVVESPSIATSSEANQSKAKDVSKALLTSARQIRARLLPLIAKETAEGSDEMALRRLTFFDHTVAGMIERFEQEYPETRLAGSPSSSPKAQEATFETEPVEPPVRNLDYDPVQVNDTFFPSALIHPDEPLRGAPLSPLTTGAPLSRRGSETSSASRAQVIEEGEMHRFGQLLRRNVFPPRGTLDHLHGTSPSDPAEPAYVTALREKAEEVRGEDLQQRVREQGIDAVMEDFISDRDCLERMERERPVEFAEWRRRLAEKRARSAMEQRGFDAPGALADADADAEAEAASEGEGEGEGDADVESDKSDQGNPGESFTAAK